MEIAGFIQVAAGSAVACVFLLGLKNTLVIAVVSIFLSSNENIRKAIDLLLYGKRDEISPPQVSVKTHAPEPRASHNSQVSRRSSSSLDVAPEIEPALNKLLNLIVQDFIALWYKNLISLGDVSFPSECRSALNTVVNKLNKRLCAIDTKEASIYLLHSLSVSFVKQLRQPSTSIDNTQLISKVRDTSRELLFEVAPPNLLQEPALSLITEILTLQVWKCIESLSDDWLNQTLITFLVVEEPKLKEAVLARKPDRDVKASLQSCIEGPSELVEALILQIEEELSKQTPLSPTIEQDPASLETLRAIVLGRSENLGDAFSEFLGTLPEANRVRSQAFVRFLGQLDSFKRVLQMTMPDLMTWRKDSLLILNRIYDGLAVEMTPQFRRICLNCLIRIMRAVECERGALDPVFAYILAELHHNYFTPFWRERQSAVTPLTAGATPSPSSTPAPSTLISTEDTSRTSLESSSSDHSSQNSSFALPSFSINVTDISAPDAYVGNKVNAKRDLAFMIAVEEASAATPGYILQRSYPEIENMNQALQKAFPMAGTVEFPRALLPSTVMKTSEDLCRNLEGYFKHLLSDDRYAISMPVQKFFEKERAGSAQPALTLWDIGREASRATKKIAKSGESAANFATKGITQGFTSGFSQVGSVLTGLKPPVPFISRKSSTSSLPSSHTVDSMPDEKPMELQGATKIQDESISGEPVAINQSVEADLSNVDEPDTPKPPPFVEQSDSSTPILLQEQSDMMNQTESPKQLPSGMQPRAAVEPPQGLTLSLQDLDHILYSALSILEQAYLITSEQWTFKRGIFRIIETVIRTSYVQLINTAFIKILSAATAGNFARKIEDLTDSFWPNGVWYATDQVIPVRTTEEIESTRQRAKDLLLAQAPEGLKLTLGTQATTEALSRVFEAYQGLGARTLASSVVIDAMRLLLL